MNAQEGTMRETLRLRRGRDAWYADFEGTSEAGEISRLFGMCLMTTTWTLGDRERCGCDGTQCAFHIRPCRARVRLDLLIDQGANYLLRCHRCVSAAMAQGARWTDMRAIEARDAAARERRG